MQKTANKQIPGLLKETGVTLREVARTSGYSYSWVRKVLVYQQSENQDIYEAALHLIQREKKRKAALNQALATYN